MTTPYERYRSLIQTYEFLQEMSKDVDMPESARRQAKTLLRHYPTPQDMELECRLHKRCVEELDLLADKHGPLHPVLVSWQLLEPVFGNATEHER